MGPRCRISSFFPNRLPSASQCGKSAPKKCGSSTFLDHCEIEGRRFGKNEEKRHLGPKFASRNQHQKCWFLRSTSLCNPVGFLVGWKWSWNACPARKSEIWGSRGIGLYISFPNCGTNLRTETCLYTKSARSGGAWGGREGGAERRHRRGVQRRRPSGDLKWSTHEHV